MQTACWRHMAKIKLLLTILTILCCASRCILSLLQDDSPIGSQDDLEWSKGDNLENGASRQYQTSIVLFGALGDLSRKYLWKAFFSLFIRRYKSVEKGHQLRIYGAGRTDEVKGMRALSQIMEQTSYCDKTVAGCTKDISSFQGISSYHKTKSEDDYKVLSEKINADLVTNGATESVRIIYLSVPPFAYPTILSFVHNHMIPVDKKTKLRIVFEKPFGHNRNSSQDLHNLIIKYYEEEEIYRVDHYLGKLAVEEIFNFRKQNEHELKYLWNDEYIESVEITLKEKVDCKGRTEYYDEYGVILDIMQNHMTEIFARIIMDLPQNDSFSEFARLKLKALKNIIPPSKDDAVLGQYAEYKKHIAEDRDLKSGRENEHQISSTIPTFAAIKMSYKSEQLGKTQFYFTSGKQLNEKSGYVRVNFKSFYYQKVSHLKNFTNYDDFYITFFIHSSSHNGPVIEIAQGLKHLNFKFSSQWEDASTDETLLLKPRLTMDAYAILIEKIDDGDKSYFVDIDSLLESWRIWDPIQTLVKRGEIPLTEYDYFKSENLDFYFDYKTNKLKFLKDDHQGTSQDSGIFSPDHSFQFSTLEDQTFLGNKLITGDPEILMENLALSIVQGINDAEGSSSTFHVAFPGGTSILPLFRRLCYMRNLFRKSHLHIWMVDERCVSLNSSKSNFNLLLDNLQKCINLPYQNLHPLPVGAGLQKCRKENAGSFAEELTSWIPSMELDFIILGVGEDGHVASLFPGDHESHQSPDWIIVNHNGPINHVSHRISMSFNLINSAKKITLIAIGPRKHGIIEALKSNNQSYINDLPVKMVKPTKGTLTWYIDNAAFN